MEGSLGALVFSTALRRAALARRSIAVLVLPFIVGGWCGMPLFVLGHDEHGMPPLLSWTVGLAGLVKVVCGTGLAVSLVAPVTPQWFRRSWWLLVGFVVAWTVGTTAVLVVADASAIR